MPHRTALLLLLVLALALRLPPMFGDLWLDEIASLLVALHAEDLASLFSRFPDHHHLNTVFMYWLGHQEQWHLYRVHSLAAGVGTVALAWSIARRHGEREAVVAAFLAGCSYPLIHFSSEARGYSLVVFFSLASLEIALRFAETRRWRWAVALWACVPLGFLSHLTYLHAFNALLAWLPIRLWRTSDSPAAAMRDAVRSLAVPGLILGVLYFAVIRHVWVGPGAGSTPLGALVEAGSAAIGGPLWGPLAIALAIVLVVATLSALALIARAGNDLWVFLAVATFVSQIVVLAVYRPEEMAVRHYLIGIACAYVAIAVAFTRPMSGAGIRRVLGLAVAGAWLAGSMLGTARLYTDGRGQYLAGFEHVVATSGPGEIVITSDYDFRHRAMLMFYEQYLPPDRRPLYVDRDALAGRIPDWLLTHGGGAPRAPPAEIEAEWGVRYVLDRTLPTSGLSGWHGYLYRRDAGP